MRAPRPLEIEAVAGQPFGVGRITFELPQDMLPEPLGIEGIGLGEKHGRVLYPTLDNPAFGKMMKEFLDGGTPLTSGGPVREEVGGMLRGILDRPPRTTLYFLFRGAEPLELSLEARESIPLSVVPRQQPRRTPAIAATVVAAIRQAGRPVPAEARLSARGR